MKYYLGISAGFHDAAATVISTDGEIVFAGHSERYSKVKNDPELHPALVADCLGRRFQGIAFYERPWWHNYQQWRSGQHCYGPWTLEGALDRHLGPEWHRMEPAEVDCYPHHLSHAAAGFQTSPFDDAAVVVIDAIGEMDTISIYRAWYDHGQARYRRVWRQTYPHSIGLFYSAATQGCGLKPMDEEYITMGMAAYGNNKDHPRLARAVIADLEDLRFRQNLHTGLEPSLVATYGAEDLAAVAQYLAKRMVLSVMARAQKLGNSRNLVYMGGVALNCVINQHLPEYFDRVWIMPNPGDAGSSMGAAALMWGRRLQWRDAFLGHIIPGSYPVEAAVSELLNRGIVGVASGAAEFGPRALGNRSLLADPRGIRIKDRVNDIKRRQKFRPFAPAILEELCGDYFDMPCGWNHSRYMQVVADCRRPDLFPAIVHVDGTSRVQTVPRDGSGLRRLLERWYAETGCPMLLNTSLNIRGEPMVNDRFDADRFERLYGVQVCS